MPTYHEERLRRVGQFTSFVKAMEERTHREAQSDCFLIFAESPKSPRVGNASLHASKELAMPVEEPVLARAGKPDFLTTNPGLFTNDGLYPSETPPQSQSNPESPRFVQFLFRQRTFSMDLPNTTIFPPEIERLLRDRSGFVPEAMIGRPLTFEEHVQLFDPVSKEYLYGDEQSVAEDTAYVFFDLWRFPVNTRLFVDAAAFDGTHRWERGHPIE